MGGQRVMDPTPSPSPVNTRVLVSISPFVRSVRLTTPEASPTQSSEQVASVTIDVTAATCTPSSPTNWYPRDSVPDSSPGGCEPPPPAEARSSPLSSCRIKPFCSPLSNGERSLFFCVFPPEDSSAATWTSTDPHARPTTSSEPPHATWHRVTALSAAVVPALGPGASGSQSSTSRPGLSSSEKTRIFQSDPEGIASRCISRSRRVAHLAPASSTCPPVIGHSCPHASRSA
mmetsp:Transcript_8711/g.39619  ORF Transcript_8711/g.39619 Transcript_8711/m.39619 type:complete len:231 (-) Transcript_8711:458-1150(-)